MRRILSERNIVAILFVLVLITFSLAQEDSRKMEKMYTGIQAKSSSNLLVEQTEINLKKDVSSGLSAVR